MVATDHDQHHNRHQPVIESRAGFSETVAAERDWLVRWFLPQPLCLRQKAASRPQCHRARRGHLGLLSLGNLARRTIDYATVHSGSSLFYALS